MTKRFFLKKTRKSIGCLIREVKIEELKYENLLILLAVLIIVYVLFSPEYFQMLKNFIEASGKYGYIGMFIAGFFFAYGFTAPISTALLIGFGSAFNPLAVGLVGALGATIGDFIVFSFSKRKLSGEIKEFERKPILKKYSKLIHHLAPIIAGLIIASPLPDEIGAAILGTLKFTDKKFILFIFVAELIGITVLASIGSAI